MKPSDFDSVVRRTVHRDVELSVQLTPGYKGGANQPFRRMLGCSVLFHIHYMRFQSEQFEDRLVPYFLQVERWNCQVITIGTTVSRRVEDENWCRPVRLETNVQSDGSYL